MGLVSKNNPHAVLLFTSDIEALVRDSIRDLPLSEEKCYSGELLPMPEEQSNVYPRSIYIGKNRYCDLLYAMQRRTGVRPEDIPLTDEGVLSLVCDVSQKEIKNLPLFGSEDVREIISSTAPKTFDDLVKINGNGAIYFYQGSCMFICYNGLSNTMVKALLSRGVFVVL